MNNTQLPKQSDLGFVIMRFVIGLVLFFLWTFAISVARKNYFNLSSANALLVSWGVVFIWVWYVETPEWFSGIVLIVAAVVVEAFRTSLSPVSPEFNAPAYMAIFEAIKIIGPAVGGNMLYSAVIKNRKKNPDSSKN